MYMIINIFVIYLKYIEELFKCNILIEVWCVCYFYLVFYIFWVVFIIKWNEVIIFDIYVWNIIIKYLLKIS